MTGGLSGASILVLSIAVASTSATTVVGLEYMAWSYQDLALASDDFWDRCRHVASAGELEPGRYEALVWSQRNSAGQCEDVRGYCKVTGGDVPFGYSEDEDQVIRVADRSSNCTFLGWMFSDVPPFRKVN